MALFDNEYDPVLERHVEYLYEEAKHFIRQTIISHVTGKIRGSIELLKYNLRIRPNFSIDVRQIDEEGRIGVEMHVTVYLDEKLLENVKKKIRAEVYAKGRDVKIKAQVLRRLVFNELRSSSYGIQDLYSGAPKARDKIRRSGTALWHQEGGLDYQNVDEDFGRGDKDIEHMSDEEEVQ